MVPWVGEQYVIMVFSDHTQLLFANLKYLLNCILWITKGVLSNILHILHKGTIFV